MINFFVDFCGTFESTIDIKTLTLNLGLKLISWFEVVLNFLPKTGLKLTVKNTKGHMFIQNHM